MSFEKELKEELSFLKVGNNIKYIHDLPSHLKDPNYFHKLVIYTYKHDPYRVQKLLENGWEIVYAEGSELDDRGSGNKAKTNGKSSPILIDKKSGHKAVWMRIPVRLWEQRITEKAEKDRQRLVEATKIQKTRHGTRVSDDSSTF